MTKKIDTGGAAYPIKQTYYTDGKVPVEYAIDAQQGMTWLDVAAIRAMQSILVNCIPASIARESDLSALAQESYRIGQALLAEKRRIEKGEE